MDIGKELETLEVEPVEKPAEKPEPKPVPVRT